MKNIKKQFFFNRIAKTSYIFIDRLPKIIVYSIYFIIGSFDRQYISKYATASEIEHQKHYNWIFLCNIHVFVYHYEDFMDYITINATIKFMTCFDIINVQYSISH